MAAHRQSMTWMRNYPMLLPSLGIEISAECGSKQARARMGRMPLLQGIALYQTISPTWVSVTETHDESAAGCCVKACPQHVAARFTCMPQGVSLLTTTQPSAQWQRKHLPQLIDQC
eukprot:5549-Pelagomonas_calceolata.AAC.2